MSDLHTPGPWVATGEVKRVTGDYLWCGSVEPVAAPGGYRGTIASIQSAAHIAGITNVEAKANAHLIAAAPILLNQLKTARAMLANYAAYDERHGLADDAAYTRRQLVDIDAAIASASPEIAPTAKSEPSNVVQIGDHDPEHVRTVDAVAGIVGAPQFDGAAS